jgi:hypothetical protein
VGSFDVSISSSAIFSLGRVVTSFSSGGLVDDCLFFFQAHLLPLLLHILLEVDAAAQAVTETEQRCGQQLSTKVHEIKYS